MHCDTWQQVPILLRLNSEQPSCDRHQSILHASSRAQLMAYKRNIHSIPHLPLHDSGQARRRCTCPIQEVQLLLLRCATAPLNALTVSSSGLHAPTRSLQGAASQGAHLRASRELSSIADGTLSQVSLLTAIRRPRLLTSSVVIASRSPRIERMIVDNALNEASWSTFALLDRVSCSVLNPAREASTLQVNTASQPSARHCSADEASAAAAGVEGCKNSREKSAIAGGTRIASEPAPNCK